MPELKKFNLEDYDIASKGVDVEIERGGEELGVGLSEGTVRRVSVEVFGPKNTSRKIGLAEKELHPDAYTTHQGKMRMIGHILRNHALLKKHKLPTYPTLRVDESDMSALYMTDLTRGGVDEVYSYPDWMTGFGRKGKLHGSKETICLINNNELSQSIANLYRHSVHAGCGMHDSDAFFLVVNKKTRIAKILLGDLYNLDFTSRISETLVQQNYQIFSDFIREMNRRLSIEDQLEQRYIDLAHEDLLKEIREKNSAESDGEVNAE